MTVDRKIHAIVYRTATLLPDATIVFHATMNESSPVATTKSVSALRSTFLNVNRSLSRFPNPLKSWNP